jgi:hypothetical protein
VKFPEKEYINGIFVAVYYTTFYNLAVVRNGGYVVGGGRGEMHKINAPPNNCLRCQNR